MAHILFVESYPHVLFGQQRTLLSLLEACGDMGIKPSVAVTADGLFTEIVRRRAIDLVEFPYPESLSQYGGAIYRTRGLRWLRMMGQLSGYILGIRHKLSRLRVDAVFCNDMRGLLTVGIAARSLGLPVIIWDKLDKPHGWMDWVQLPLVTLNIIISDAVKSKYPGWQIKIFKNRIIKISEGADLALLKKANSIRSQLPGAPQDILLAMVGSITPRKGHDRIFSIWPDLIQACPTVRLLVIGEPSGNEDESYRASLPNRDHSRIHFLGMREDVPDLMRSIDLLLVPSRQEGMGLVIVEAMAAQVPVIGAKAGGIPEVIVNEETGLVVNGDDSEAWIKAIRRLVESSELRTQMGLNALSRVEKEFNRPVQLAKVLEVCLKAVDGH